MNIKTKTTINRVNSGETKLALIRGIHTAIYLVMVAAIFYIVYCGLTRIYNRLVLYSVVLVLLEGVVFFGNKMRCPLTNLAQKYGDPSGHVGDSFLPVIITKYTFRVFTAIFLFGLLLLLLNFLKMR